MQRLMTGIFEVVTQVNGISDKLGVGKLLAFHLMDLSMVLLDAQFTLSRSTTVVAVYFHLGFTALVLAVGLLGLALGTDGFARYLIAGTLYPVDYVITQLKLYTLVLLFARSQGQVWQRYALLFDYFLFFLLTHTIVGFLRSWIPNKSHFHSVIRSPYEHALFAVVPLRVVMIELIPQDSSIGKALRVAIVAATTLVLCYLFVLHKPFFNKLAEVVHVNAVMLTGIFAVTCMLSGDKKVDRGLPVVVMCAPFVVYYFNLKLNMQADLKIIGGQACGLWEIKDLLVGEGANSIHSLKRLGKFRSYFVSTKKLSMALAENLPLLNLNFDIQPTKADDKEPQATNTTAAPLTSLNIITAETPRNGQARGIKQRSQPPPLPQQKENPGTNFPLQSQVSQKQEADHGSDDFISNIKLFTKNKRLGVLSGSSDRDAEKKQEAAKIEELLIDSYLGEDPSTQGDSYRCFLKLVWAINKQFSLFKIFKLLSHLKFQSSKFGSKYLYLVAKKEVEKKLQTLDLNQHFRTRRLKSIKELSKRANKKFSESENDKLKRQELSRQVRHCSQEVVDLLYPFLYKEQMEAISRDISRFSILNMDYLEQIAHFHQNLKKRLSLCNQMYVLDEAVCRKYDEFESFCNSADFQHLIPYYYHCFYNVNRHETTEGLRKRIRDRYAKMREDLLRRNKSIANSNIINDSVVLMIESHRSRHGIISDVYGKSQMFIEDLNEIIGGSYELFMTESLARLHQYIRDFVYHEPMGQMMGFELTVQRKGLIKVPFRNLVLPSIVLVKVCPDMKHDFKFLVAIKPMIHDSSNLYICVSAANQIEGYSAGFLSHFPEHYLTAGLSLEKVCPSLHQEIRQLRPESQIPPYLRYKDKRPPQVRHRSSMSRNTQIRSFNENKLATFLSDGASSTNLQQNSPPFQGNEEEDKEEITQNEAFKLFSSEQEDTFVERKFKIVAKKHYFAAHRFEIREGSLPFGFWFLFLTSNKETDGAEHRGVAAGPFFQDLENENTATPKAVKAGSKNRSDSSLA